MKINQVNGLWVLEFPRPFHLSGVIGLAYNVVLEICRSKGSKLSWVVRSKGKIVASGINDVDYVIDPVLGTGFSITNAQLVVRTARLPYININYSGLDWEGRIYMLAESTCWAQTLLGTPLLT